MGISIDGRPALGMQEVCKKLDVSKSCVYRWLKNDGFPDKVKIGNKPYWTEKDIDKWVSQKHSNQQNIQTPEETQPASKPIRSPLIETLLPHIKEALIPWLETYLSQRDEDLTVTVTQELLGTIR